MSDYTLAPADAFPGADFAIVLAEAIPPLFRKGDTVRLQRSAELSDGEVGLFHTRCGMELRQFCQDIRGTIYLFALDREERERDLCFPPEGEAPTCYGRVLLDRLPELPMD